MASSQWVVIPILAGLGAACDAEPTVPPWPAIQLSARAQLPGDFTSLGSVIELDDSLLLICDPAEGRLRIIDLAGDSLWDVGRSGDGPGEYRTPTAAFRTADVVVVYDRRARRLTVLTGSLGVNRIVPLTGDTLWAATPAGLDRRGRIYFEYPTGAAAGARDSVALIRWDPHAQELDPLLNLDATDLITTSRTRAEPGTVETFTFSTPSRFSVGDDWTVVGGSRLLVVRAHPFHIESHDLDGVLRRSGPVIPVPRVRLSPSEGYDAGPSAGSERKPFKPPFRDGSTISSPAGWTWVGLHWADTALARSFLVLDTSGAIAGVTSLPRDERLLALGTDAAYVATQNEVGLLHVARYRVSYH